MGRDFDQIRLTVAARESPGEASLPAEALKLYER
jgi:hypothetical protein